jgi:predicted acetyltransferase
MMLRLRPFNTSDEAAAIAIHEEMLAEDSHFLRFWQPSMPWSAFLQSNDELRQGLDPSNYRVRGCQLAAVVDGVIVGRTSLRYELNEFFAERGGHVGYAVAPAHRRKGYATEILRQSLIILRAEGVERALVTCNDDNLGSALTIEHNGGVLESIVPLKDEGLDIRRYWIN